MPPTVAVTVLPGSPMPEKIAVSSSEILVSWGSSTSKSIAMTSMLIGIEFAFEPNWSDATNTTSLIDQPDISGSKKAIDVGLYLATPSADTDITTGYSSSEDISSSS